ncbi:unnamed protein product [Didymodactylos carnosus]|uniref:Uncharacterized protein n=1 Tax=Didymodactylos carnosus TaxID=1234261 RepID=A0A8S2ST80_9BILA|nr:unnamed protein product [Didymodactylos carnosus]CAF4239837.1 unnamed protein product [Didymodactylos carnosus]
MAGYKIICIPNQQTRGEVQTNLRLEFDNDPDNRMVYIIVAEVAVTPTHTAYDSTNYIQERDASLKHEHGMDDSFLDKMDSKDLDAMDRTMKDALICSQQTINDELDLSFLNELNGSGLAGSINSETNDDHGKQTDDNVYSAIRQLTSSIVAELCGKINHFSATPV